MIIMMIMISCVQLRQLLRKKQQNGTDTPVT